MSEEITIITNSNEVLGQITYQAVASYYQQQQEIVELLDECVDVLDNSQLHDFIEKLNEQYSVQIKEAQDNVHASRADDAHAIYEEDEL